MEEIAIELDDEIAAWLELIAAERNKSVSEIIGVLIREHRERVARAKQEAG